MARREKLTKTLIDSLEFDESKKGPQFVWDTQLINFGVRVHSRHKSFVIFYRRGNKKRYKQIGRFGLITLAKARELAKQYFNALASGEDPFVALEKKRSEPTVKEFFTDYLEKYAIKKKSYRDDKRYAEYAISRWGNRRISQVTRSDVERYHRDLTESGSDYAANRFVAFVRRAYNLCETLGYEQYPNPAITIAKNKEKQRHRYLSAEEFQRLIDVIAGEVTPYRQLFGLYLATGLRKKELLHIEWKDVSIWQEGPRIKGSLTIQSERAKNGELHTVPLMSESILLFQELPNISRWCFPSPTKADAPICDAAVPWRRIKRKAEIEDVRLHDLRRHFATMVLESGAPIDVVGRLLNHKNRQTTLVYAHRSMDTKLEAVERISPQLSHLTRYKNKTS